MVGAWRHCIHSEERLGVMLAMLYHAAQPRGVGLWKFGNTQGFAGIPRHADGWMMMGGWLGG